MTNALDQLAARIAALEERVLKPTRATQLEHTALEDGSIREFTVDGSQVAQYGKQYDGTSAPAILTSPMPPQPSAPVAAAAPGGITVAFDGTFAAGLDVVAPMDFKGFDIAVGPVGFDPIATPPVATITSARGGVFFVALPPGNYEAAVVTRTLAGQPSFPSAKDGATALAVPSDADVAQAVADAAAAQAAADAAQGTADSALASANGKNAVIHADYDPVAEANTLGDTWFTHDTTSGAIIAQWRGLGGTAWQQDTISHQVISSIDLGVATVGKLAANFIDTGTLSAAIQIAGMLIAGNPSGARVVIDGAGIRQYSSANDIRINLPTDPDAPAQFEGNAIMDSLTVNDFFALRGVNNELSKGAVITLSNGTTAPTSAPSIAAGYATYTSARHTASTYFAATSHYGSVDDTEDFVGTYIFYGQGQVYGSGGRKYLWPLRTDSEGSSRSTYIATSAAIIAVGGVERLVIAGNRCLNNGDIAQAYLTSLDLAPMNISGSVAPTVKASLSITNDNYVWVTKIGRVYSSNNSWANRFCLGIADYLSSQFTLKIYSATDAAFTQQGANVVVPSPLVADEAYCGITYGDSVKMGFQGAAQSLWLIHGSVNTYAYSSAGVRLPQFDFPTPPGQAVMTAWGDTVNNGFIGFRTTAWDPKSPITKLTNNHWDSTVTSNKWWVSATWYDPDATGGTHETAQSARASITMPKRAGLTFTVPTFPARPLPTTTDDVTAARVYIARGATDPGRANMERATTVNSPTRSGYIGTFTFPAGAAVAPPPATSNFPATSPGRITTADGTTIVIEGSGQNSKFGTLEVGLNGGTTLKNSIEISLGDSTSASARLLRFFKKASSGTNIYEGRDYMYDGTTTSGRAWVLWENGVETGRTQLMPNGMFDVRSVAGTADIGIQQVSIGRGVMPGGLAGIVADSNTVASTTITDVAGLTCTVTIPAGRRIRLSFYGAQKSSVAGDRASLIIREGTTNLQVSQTAAMPTANSSVNNATSIVIEPTAGTHTYKVSMQRVSGTGNVQVTGSAAIASQLVVEDIGAAGV